MYYCWRNSGGLHLHRRCVWKYCWARSSLPSRSQIELSLLSTKDQVTDGLAVIRGVPWKVEVEVDVLVPNKAATPWKRLGPVSGKRALNAGLFTYS